MTKADQALTRTIGQRLRAAREARGLSLSQLADLTGGLYSKPRISNYEQGLRRVTIEGAQILSQALGNVAVAHILWVDDHCAASPEETALLAGFRTLASSDRQQVLDSIKEKSGT